MEFALVCIGMIVVVGVIALIANHFDKGDDEITVAHDCATCTAAQEGDCKIHCLLEEKKKKEVEQGGSCTGDGT
jgi:hypothetical protein